jgi:hypothetical protein
MGRKKKDWKNSKERQTQRVVYYYCHREVEVSDEEDEEDDEFMTVVEEGCDSAFSRS